MGIWRWHILPSAHQRRIRQRTFYFYSNFNFTFNSKSNPLEAASVTWLLI